MTYAGDTWRQTKLLMESHTEATRLLRSEGGSQKAAEKGRVGCSLGQKAATAVGLKPGAFTS